MNTKLGELLNRTRTIGFEYIWRKVFSDERLKRQIILWIQNDQLQKGIDEDGDILGLYSDFTEFINPEKIAGTPYTLKDTGDFYNSMFITVYADSFIVDADAIKVDDSGEQTDLFKKFGDGIVGLTKENKQKLADEIKKRFQIKTSKALHGN
jgi:hypothetical protein